MHQFVRNLITEWRKLDLAFKGETVIVGVSGGADSVSLLLAMDELRQSEKLKLRIVAAHFNHRLRDGESDADEEFVRNLTGERRIEFAVGPAGPPEAGNIEQNARIARYDFLRRTAESLNAFAILTGHTVNDQAETFLMNLIRGSGIEGLSAMRSVRSFGSENFELETLNSKLTLVRPLLSWAKRIDTETFCHDLGVEYRYDTMNEDTAFKRVRIRKILLPLLEDFNPKIIETLANTANLMQNSADRTAVGNRLPETDELILSEVKVLPKSELYVRVRSWLRHHRGNMRRLERKHIQAIERLILSGKSGKVAELPGANVVKSAGKLVYKENKVEN